MADTQERRKHFRGSPRPGRRVEIRFRPKGSSDKHQQAVTRNVGVGGAFIVYAGEPPKVGDTLELLVEVPGTEDSEAKTINVDGEVRWGSDGDRTGFGVKFLSLGVDGLLTLSEYFASLTNPG